MDIVEQKAFQAFEGNKMDYHIEKIKSNCRLSELNFDCLEKIFEILSTAELINLCNMCPVVCHAIKERALKKRMVNCDDWNRIWNIETIFEELGEWMKCLSIGEHNICPNTCLQSTAFNYFLNLLVKNCTEHRFTLLSLSFDIDDLDLNLLNVAKPFFTQLQKLHYASIGRGPNADHEHFLDVIINSSENLNTIQLQNTSGKGVWLRTLKMKNVQNIALINSFISDEANWDFYFRQEPSLKSFAWINETIPNPMLCEKVVRNSLHLERFVDIQYSVPDEFLSDSFTRDRYSYLADAQNLKCARVTAYTRSGQDLINLFIRMAQTNSVQHLSVNFLRNASQHFNYEWNRYRIYNRYPHFTSCRSLDIQNNSSCMFWVILIENFLCELLNLQSLTISSCELMNTVQLTQIALAPPNLKVLRINNAQTSDLYTTLHTIGKVCKGKMTVYINSEQSMSIVNRAISKRIQIIVV